MFRSSTIIRDLALSLAEVIKVNQSRNRPGVAQRVPESYGSQIS